MNYDQVVADLMNEVTVRTKKKPSLSDEKLEFLKIVTVAIEPAAKSAYCDAVDISLSETGRDLDIAFCGEDLEIQNGRKNPFYELVEKANYVRINSEEDYAKVVLTFTDVWELIDVE